MSKHEAKNIDPSHLAGWQDDESCLSFEELFQGHLKNVISQEGEDQREPVDQPGRLSPLIKLKLNPRIVN